jgi:cytochrome c oxidase subunit II
MVVLMASRTRIGVLGLLGLLGVAPALARQPQDAPAAATQTVDIVAERFLFTPSEITVAAGSALEIRLTSDDTDHGFRIVGTDINVTIPKRGRGEIVVRFDAREAGDYQFECSHICGAGHSFMRGRIRVKASRPSAGVDR